MQITSWNVNGLRAALGKGFLDNIQELNPDILCLQEIKSRKDQIDPTNLDALQKIFPSMNWNHAFRPGYSGTASMAKIFPSHLDFGIGIEEADNEGRLIASQYDKFWLFNIYFPNGQHDLGRVPFKLDYYARLLEICDSLHAKGENIILCGDFNTAHNEIDIKHPKANSTATGFLPEERAWIDTYISHNFVDAFRYLYPDKIEYTWWTFLANARKNNVGWRLDYFLVSDRLINSVVDVINHTEIYGSDHCPVSLILKD